jgi:hypothetical protein
MKIFAIAAAAFAVGLSFLAITPAQARWAPTGPYESSCRGVDFDGDMLTASCRRRDGGWRNTWLDNADDCDGRIVNDNGQLECTTSGWRRDRWRAYDDGPRGTYRDTCANIRMDGYTLRASCQRRNGSWRWTSLDDAFACDDRIANFDGRLVCTRGRYR